MSINQTSRRFVAQQKDIICPASQWQRPMFGARARPRVATARRRPPAQFGAERTGALSHSSRHIIIRIQTEKKKFKSPSSPWAPEKICLLPPSSPRGRAALSSKFPKFSPKISKIRRRSGPNRRNPTDPSKFPFHSPPSGKNSKSFPSPSQIPPHLGYK